MKKLVAVVAGAAVIAGSAFAGNGQAIFQQNGCAGCHQPAVDTVGPSLKKIAQVYAGRKDELVAFLKGVTKPKVDPAKAPMMMPQLNRTKSLPQDKLEALADYILSHK
ncbi:MAG: cytochrome C552 [Hydrogenothermus sp.]|nr:MAG: cytochrome C552 [Hydrogenothermus sp.]